MSDKSRENDTLDVLIAAAKEDDSEAFSELCHRYEKMLWRAVTRRSGFMDTPKDDLFQEAMLAFYRAAKSFKPDNGKVTFGLYARRCVSNALISLQRKEMSAKRKRNRLKESEESGMNVGEFTGELPYWASKCLTEYELAAFRLFLEDKSYDEIASALNSDRKSVGNALYRARVKLRKKKTEIGS